MATQTHTLRKPPVQSSRVHDYLYDPLHTTSSERDHARCTFKAHTSTDRIKRVPVYPTMFSELRHYPRFNMRLDVTDPVPRFIGRQWKGYAEQQREALVRHTTFNYAPGVTVPPKSYENAEVSGSNRFKYFRRPIIPFLQQVPPDVLLASARQDPMGAGAGTEQDAVLDRPLTPMTKTVMTQTDYRDSEAQTDPYTPEYVVRPGSQPELLTLATLSYGRGLPAGLAEVEMIERARSKRAWEATLPALHDTDQLDKRRRMMDDMERKEWALREQEIEKLQEARLEVLKNLLKQREEQHAELQTKRLDRLWATKQKDKENQVDKIRNHHIKTIRKLTEKRRNVEGKLERRDVVKDYSQYGSQTYAPLTRIGVFLDRGSEQYVVRSRYLSTYGGLLELENSLPDFVTQPRIKAPKPKTVTKAGFVKRKYRQEQQLKEIHQVLKDSKSREVESPKALRFLQHVEKPVPRPATPTTAAPPDGEEEFELAAVALQAVIRGRAIQNMMFEGKEKRAELIKELRSTHALQEAQANVKKQERQATLALQRQRRLHEHKEYLVDEGLSSLEGGALGDALDFLSKELIRLQEERRIHAFSMLAERQRRVREAEESGRRQVEERIRREQDEVFKQVISVHQASVDTYLEDIIMSTLDNAAGEQARTEIEELAVKINDVAYEMEDRRTQLESEEMVSELVHGFLLPEVYKAGVREKVTHSQRKFLVAAHKEIHGETEGIIDMHPTQPASTPTASNPVQDEGNTNVNANPVSSRSRSATPQQRPLSGNKQDKTSDSPRSRPGSAASVKSQASARSVTSVKSAASAKSAASTRSNKSGVGLDLAVEGKGSQTASHPTTDQLPADDKSNSARGSRPGSRTATPSGGKPPTPDPAGQKTPTRSKPPTPTGSKTPTPRGSKTPTPAGSKPPSPTGSKPPTPTGSKTPTPRGSKTPTPRNSKPPSPTGSNTSMPKEPRTPTPTSIKDASPRDAKTPSLKGSHPTTPSGSKPPTPARSKAATPTSPAGSKAQTPVGLKAGSPAGSPRDGTTGSRPASETGSRSGSRPTSAASRPPSAASNK